MRGGTRKGAGRPKIDPNEKRVQLSLSIGAAGAAWLRKHAEEMGVTMGVIVETLIDVFEDVSKKDDL